MQHLSLNVEPDPGDLKAQQADLPPTPINVLFMLPTLQGGGAEKTMVDLIRSFATESIKPTLAVFHLHNAIYVSKVPRGCPIINMDCKRARKSPVAILRTVWRIRPEILLVSLSHLILLVGLMRWLLPPRVKLVAQQVAMLSTLIGKGRNPRLEIFFYRLSYSRFDLIICVSNAVAEDLHKTLGIGSEKLKVIYNPVDQADIASQLADAAACAEADEYFRTFPRGVSLLLAAGGLNRNKGFDLLIDAMVLCNNDNLHAVILGDGEETAALQAQIARNGLTHRVHLVGFKRRPCSWLRRADAFVLTSRAEAFGNVMIEAIACGLPVIATPAYGAVREILQDIPGCIVATDISAPALAEAIRSWCRTPRIRLNPAVVDKYAIGGISTSYINSFRAVLTSGSREGIT